MALRVIFMGTPEFAVPALERIAEAGHDIICVYTQPPRAAGRGQKELKSAVHAAADALGIEVRTPRSLKPLAEQAAFEALDADIAVVAAYGLILPLKVLKAPHHGCINIHASLLPRWRGAAPIQRAIAAGDTETGISIMAVEEGLDSGPVYARKAVPIAPDETAGSLHDRLARLGADLVVEVLDEIERGTATAEPQDDARATYAKKVEKSEARLDFVRVAEVLERHIRAMNPSPGAFTEIAGERVKILAADIEEGEGTPGEVLDDDLKIACGRGALRPTRLQRGGKAVVERRDFLNGFAVFRGARIGQ